MDALQQAQLLRVEAKVVALGKDRVDPGEQARIEEDCTAMARQQGRHVTFHGPQGIIRHGAGQVVEDSRNLQKVLACKLERCDRIVEVRFGWIADEGLDLLPVTSHGRLEGGAELGRFDPVERGHGEGGLPDFGKGLGGHTGLLS